MQYLAAYALASLSGKEPTADQLNNILKATGQNVDDKEVNAVIEKLKGKKLEDVIKAGSAKVGASSGPAPQQAKKQQAKPAANNKAPAKKAPEPEPEDEEEGMGGLFD